MAVQLIFAPNYAVDTGEFAAGARATFFESGTTTPITVYSDEALTVPHDSPLLADATGRFPTVWSEDATNVKVVVTDAGGSALYTQDKSVLGNIAVGNAASVSFAPQPNNVATNVQAAIENNSDAIDDLAPLASPALTGTPTAPTAAAATNTTQIATTAFVQSARTVDLLDTSYHNQPSDGLFYEITGLSNSIYSHYKIIANVRPQAVDDILLLRLNNISSASYSGGDILSSVSFTGQNAFQVTFDPINRTASAYPATAEITVYANPSVISTPTNPRIRSFASFVGTGETTPTERNMEGYLADTTPITSIQIGFVFSTSWEGEFTVYGYRK